MGGSVPRETLAQLCVLLPLISADTSPDSCASQAVVAVEAANGKKPSPTARAQISSQIKLARSTAHYIGCQIPLGTFEEFKFHGFTLIQGAISIFLNGRKMNENVFPG
jgi:hypothetical protein